jgi:CHASE2 domain-containing sensor protein
LSIATILTALDSPLLARSERQLQTFFFELRGSRSAPENVVILAIDDESMAQSEHYRSDPQKYAALAPIQQWPWHREAYAIAIKRLLQAGAKSVSLDLLLSTPSAYGAADDQSLVEVLTEYGDRVTLAIKHEDAGLRQGVLLKPSLPLPQFQTAETHLGNINFPLELDGRIHRQGHTFFDDLAALTEPLPEAADPSAIATRVTPSETPDTPILSFAEATMRAAQVPYDVTQGTDIHFWGPARTFEHIPFWYVLDPDLWTNYLDSGAVFKDKIVLIGATSGLLQDFHDSPFAKGLSYPFPMPGVEILANDVATLQTGLALRSLIPSPYVRAGLVLILGLALIPWLSHCRRTLSRLLWTGGIGLGWLALSFAAFVGGGWILPTASVITALLACGTSYAFIGLVSEQVRRQRLRRTLAQYVTSPIVQEIISQEEDLQDLLEARQAEVVGTMLGGRYQVLSVLGYGGFSETYTASDTQRPGNPVCVVKRLRIVSDDPKAHELAHRLFVAEANTLERLGHHNQIPQLLAHFDTFSSFYLIEEMIRGITLKDELVSRKPQSQAWVMNFLLDLLPVVEFVHAQGVIHRDIKPSNLIRRAGDGRVVLIDFGSVKEISNQLIDSDAHVTSTIGIGTKGYMPSEQSAGMPRFSSDLYAVGVTAIEALTGRSPYKLTYDDRGELIWQYLVPDLNPALAEVLTKMVRYDFSQRYSSVQEVLAALREIPVTLPDSIVAESEQPTLPNFQDAVEEEERWDEPTGYLPTDWATASTEPATNAVPLAQEENSRT